MKLSLMLFLGMFALQIALGNTNGKSGNTLAKISVSPGEFERFDTPLSLPLDNVTSVHESELKLYELAKGELVPVDAQFSAEGQRYIHWILRGRTEPGEARVFELRNETGLSESNTMRVEKKPDAYVMFSGDQPVLQYNSGTVFPPEGANPAYQRSGFIHPLYAPNEVVMTNIQPPDHMHHYGIWNPWTKTTFRGEEIDFWNLAKEQGRVRFSGLTSLNEGAVFGSIQVLHEHIVWPFSLRETIAMNELQEIKVFNRDDGTFMIDIDSRLSPTEKLILEEYRYGGFVLRATEYWTNQNSSLLTSEGLDRDHADGQRAFWCVVKGDTPRGPVSILMMGHPANYNHPQPLRVWDSNANRGRGDHFINFSPTRNTQWVLNSGNHYFLRYRIFVFEGEIDSAVAENLWNDYANPPEMIIEK